MTQSTLSEGRLGPEVQTRLVQLKPLAGMEVDVPDTSAWPEASAALRSAKSLPYQKRD